MPPRWSRTRCARGWKTRIGSRRRAACSPRLRGEALDRLAALSARLLGAAHAQIALIAEAPAVVAPSVRRTARDRGADRAARSSTAARSSLAHVQRGGVAAFLGVPIDVSGARVGVLCVYDIEPHQWTRHDTETLRELAGTVAAELERGALAAELESSSVRLDLGFAAASIGSFDWNLVTNALHWDDRLMELFGYESETYVPHIDSFSVRLHPDDRAKTEAAIARAIESLRRLRGRLPRRAPRRQRALGRGPRARAGRPGRPARADARRGLRHDRRPQRRRAPRARAGDDEHRVLHDRPRLALHLRQRRGRADPRARRPRRPGHLGGLRRPRRDRERHQLPRARWRPASRAASSSSTRRWTPTSTCA